MASLAASSGGSKGTRVTSKSWFITYHEEMLIWKQGERLKLQHDVSAGRVISASILNEKEKTIKLKGCCKDDRHHTFNAHLSAFQKDAPFLDNPRLFCQKVSEFTDGTVINDSKDLPQAGPSRKRSSTSAPTGTSKKAKLEERKDEVQQEISENEIGVFSLPVNTLQDPPGFLRVREVKDWYVDYLANMLHEDKGDHEDLTAPLLVIASVNKDGFQERNIGKYTYEVIGGIQRFSAIKRINESEHGGSITARKCAVYGNGLSRAAKLVLARQHNEYNQIQRLTSFPEMAACCRRLMFAHFAPSESDDGTYAPEVPRYNTQDYRNFKQECLTFLVSSQASQSMVEQAIQMALQPPSSYHKMQRAFCMYEEGQAKGQKAREMTGATLQKALEGKLAPKLTHFKIFQGLQVEEKDKLLDDIIAGKLSFSEAESQSKRSKCLNEVKDAFLKEVGLSSMDQAKEAVKHAGGMALLETMQLKQGKPYPKNFEAFCYKARSYLSTRSRTAHQISPFYEDRNNSFFVADMGKLFDMDFSDSQLIFISLVNITSPELMESAIQAISQSAKDPWTLVLYNHLAVLPLEEIEKTCNLFGAKHTRVVTICSTIRADGDVHLGTAKDVVVGWWGQSHPPVGHILSEGPHVNSIVCHPQDEETMVAAEATGWIAYLCKMKPRGVTDLYSGTGEVTQVCASMGLKCCTVEETEEQTSMVMSYLGMSPASPQKNESEQIDTEELLGKLSAVEQRLARARQMGSKPGESSSQQSQRNITTRSKGIRLQWSRQMNADQPIDD